MMCGSKPYILFGNCSDNSCRISITVYQHFCVAAVDNNILFGILRLYSQADQNE